MPRVSEATKAEHRKRLLASAATEFASLGLQGARVDNISLSAGLAKGTIYNYFDSKEHVFRAVIAAWWDRAAEGRSAIPDDASTVERLRVVLEADMAVVEEQEDFARTAFREVLLAGVEGARQLLPASDPLDDALVQIMADGQQRGELRADLTVAGLVRLFAAMVNGLLFERWLPDSDVRIADIPDLAIDHFMTGASTHP